MQNCQHFTRKAGITRKMGGNRPEIGKSPARIFRQRGSKSCRAGNNVFFLSVSLRNNPNCAHFFKAFRVHYALTQRADSFKKGAFVRSTMSVIGISLVFKNMEYLVLIIAVCLIRNMKAQKSTVNKK